MIKLSNFKQDAELNKRFKELKKLASTHGVENPLRKNLKNEEFGIYPIKIEQKSKNWDGRYYWAEVSGIQVTRIHHCCGAALLSGIFTDWSAVKWSEEIQLKFCQLLIEIGEIFAVYNLTKYHLSYYVADGQKQEELALDSAGWKIKDEFFNHNSGNKVRLYTKLYTDEE